MPDDFNPKAQKSLLTEIFNFLITFPYSHLYPLGQFFDNCHHIFFPTWPIVVPPQSPFPSFFCLYPIQDLLFGGLVLYFNLNSSFVLGLSEVLKTKHIGLSSNIWWVYL